MYAHAYKLPYGKHSVNQNESTKKDGITSGRFTSCYPIKIAIDQLVYEARCAYYLEKMPFPGFR
jgi:hypothetical protein